MIDPKVTKLVKELEQQIKQVNETWAKLQKNNVFVRAEFKGTHTYDEPKSIVVTKITQNVEYLKG
jgi:hypothetical protein